MNHLIRFFAMASIIVRPLFNTVYFMCIGVAVSSQRHRNNWRPRRDRINSLWAAILPGKPRPVQTGRQSVAQRLAHWQKDADLSAVRDKKWLDAMPEADRRRWQLLWANVEALLKKAPYKQ